MNGPGMFRIQPYYDYSKTPTELPTPTCMFKMANLHDLSGPICGNEEQGENCIAALEHRQENILQTLKALEGEVITFSAKLMSQDGAGTQISTQPGTQISTQPGTQISTQPGTQISTQPGTHRSTKPASKTQTSTKPGNGTQTKTLPCKQITTTAPVANFGNVIHDIVISANPAHPPLSLFVLYHTLSSQYRCRTEVRVHSSVKHIPDQLWCCLGNGVEIGRSEAQIGITLIWKDVSHGPELKVSAQSQTPIQGEANIARYLARLISPRYDDGSIHHTCAIDDLLDLASNNILCGSSKEKAAALRTLNSTLGKSSWLAPSGEVSVADAVVWSILHQTELTKGAPGNVQKWLKACEAQKAFITALAFLS